MGKYTLSSNLGLLHLSILLILANLAVIYFFDLETSRTVRMGSCLGLFVYVLVTRGFHKSILLLGLFLMLARDATVLAYELPVFRTLSLVCTILVYGTIGFFIFKRLPTFKIDLRMMWFTIAIIVLNVFNVYYLSDIIIPVLDNDVQLFLFFIQSAVMLFMGFFAFLYNETYDGKQSLILLLSVFAFIFSDLSGLAAYFFGYEPAYYAERVFYLIAAALLVDYLIHFSPVEDQLSELNSNELSTE